jgi:hypothetical protein
MARLGAALAAFGGASAARAAAPHPSAPREASAMSAGDPWKPTRHTQDDWLDQLPGQHRFFFDATSSTGVGDAIVFASNFYAASKLGYGLNESDNAVVIGLRHFATLFAFSDAIWAKYGTHFAERVKFLDPKTQAAPVINVYLTTGYGTLLTNRETTLNAMIQRGTHFAICDLATRSFAGMVAGKTGGKSDEVYAELRAAVLPNAHFAAAGIVAVNRAQERGYSIQHIG